MVSCGSITIEASEPTFDSSAVYALDDCNVPQSVGPNESATVSVTVQNDNAVDAIVTVEWSANGQVFATDDLRVSPGAAEVASATVFYADLENVFGTGTSISSEAAVVSASDGSTAAPRSEPAAQRRNPLSTGGRR